MRNSRAASPLQSPPRPRADDETRLMARVVERDLIAFEALYRRYHPRLTRFLFNMTRRPALVDEVVNDTMLVVWSRPDSFNGTARLSSWIFAIAYRKALKALRQQDQAVEDPAAEERESADPGPDHELGERQTREALRDVLDRLSPNHRAVVELTYFQEFGYREIAEIMACPVDTVKTRMFHARRHLGRLLAGTREDWL